MCECTFLVWKVEKIVEEIEGGHFEEVLECSP